MCKESLLFRAEELTVGVAEVKENGVSLFLKADPRIVMDKLDEEFEPLGWSKKSEFITQNGRKFCVCTITVDKNGKIISRDGTSASAEWAAGNEAKVMDSDAFRRAAMCFGIGRELYSFDCIFADAKDENGNDVLKIVATQNENGETYYRCLSKFYVEQLKYSEEGKIVALSIKTTEGIRVFCENRELLYKQGTIIPNDELVTDREKAGEVLAGVGSSEISTKKISELTKEELLYVWGNTKTPKTKEACITWAKSKPEFAKFFANNGVKL